MRNIAVKQFEFRPVVHGEMSFKDYFLSRALTATLLGGAKAIVQLCYRAL